MQQPELHGPVWAHQVQAAPRACPFAHRAAGGREEGSALLLCFWPCCLVSGSCLCQSSSQLRLLTCLLKYLPRLLRFGISPPFPRLSQDGTFLTKVPDDMDWYCEMCEPPADDIEGAGAGPKIVGATATKGTKKQQAAERRKKGRGG